MTRCFIELDSSIQLSKFLCYGKFVYLAVVGLYYVSSVCTNIGSIIVLMTILYLYVLLDTFMHV